MYYNFVRQLNTDKRLIFVDCLKNKRLQRIILPAAPGSALLGEVLPLLSFVVPAIIIVTYIIRLRTKSDRDKSVFVGFG